MLTKKDITQLTRDAVSELIGMGYDSSTETDLGTLNLSQLVDFGKSLTKDGTGDVIKPELWNKTLIGRLAKFIVETRKFKMHIPKLFKDTYEWGGFIEKVKFDLAEVYDSLIYSQAPLTDSSSKFYGKTIAEIEHDRYTLNYDAKIYDEFKDFMIPYTVPGDAINAAFINPGEKQQFIAGLERTIENTITMIVNTYAHALISTAVAYTNTTDNSTVVAAVNGKPGSNTAVHLLTEWKTYSGRTTDTAADMLASTDAIKFIVERITNVRDNMSEVQAIYNNHNKAIPGININGVMLSQFKNKYNFNVNMGAMQPISLGDWDYIATWQSNNSADGEYDFKTASSIKITKDVNKGVYGVSGSGSSATATDVSLTYVVALLYDEQALGLTVDATKTTSAYTAATDTTNIFVNRRLNYAMDTDYPIVSFVLD